jgi:hypothetical protein
MPSRKSAKSAGDKTNKIQFRTFVMTNSMMKRKITAFSVFAVVMAAFIFILKPKQANSISALEENSDAKNAYYNRLLADPATGTIPNSIRQQELAFSKTLPVNVDAKREEFWKLRGPSNQGGRTRALGINTNNHNELLVGAVSGGIGGLHGSASGGDGGAAALGHELVETQLEAFLTAVGPDGAGRVIRRHQGGDGLWPGAVGFGFLRESSLPGFETRAVIAAGGRFS